MLLGIVPGTGRCISLLSAHRRPRGPAAGCNRHDGPPIRGCAGGAQRGGYGGCAASFVPVPREMRSVQFSVALGDLKGVKLGSREDATGSGGWRRKVRKGTGMVGTAWGHRLDMVAWRDDDRVPGHPVLFNRLKPQSAHRTLETNIFELIIQIKAFSPSHDTNPFNPSTKL